MRLKSRELTGAIQRGALVTNHKRYHFNSAGMLMCLSVIYCVPS